VTFVQAGEVEWTRAYGVADAPGGEPVTPRTVFQVGSMSKPVAAFGALRAVESGLLTLDDPLTAWRPPPSKHDAHGVTLRRLLSHTAGLSVRGYLGHAPGEPLAGTAESLAAAAPGGRPVRVVAPPGSRFRYAGGGYTVVQLAIERAVEEPFAAWMQRMVLDPLGMTDSSFDPTAGDGPRMAHGHDRRGRRIPTYRYAEQAAAGLHASSEDMGRFIAALMPGPSGEPPGRGVVRAESVEAMATPAPGTGGRYGLGLAVRELRGGRPMLSHGGANRGWRAHMVVLPREGWGVVVATNGDRGGAVIRAVARAIRPRTRSGRRAI
jgi:CubicO group peptidase (beta-lactamase class C family)